MHCHSVWVDIRWMIMKMIGLLVILFYGVSKLFESFNTELSHFDKSFKQLSLVHWLAFAYTKQNGKTILV